MSAPPKSDAPLITPDDLAEADGFVFGFPTRFGMMAGLLRFNRWTLEDSATRRLTAITQLVHHGAGTFAGDGSRQPTELELEQAFHQGKYIAAISKKLKGPAAA
ncbi:hypothetical protein F2Q69_00034177 [Brassica cretica]|uniref:NAD(P)H dehydrogenase (quinone) n=1 Tax=Brassica cretica TaxID=69181 RepID=A0A8S9SRZ7_BRACR|nr:hypothetical protein F2Q69_00034177 [Brassica cretica]